LVYGVKICTINKTLKDERFLFRCLSINEVFHSKLLCNFYHIVGNAKTVTINDKPINSSICVINFVVVTLSVNPELCPTYIAAQCFRNSCRLLDISVSKIQGSKTAINLKID
jgi:hypothetical protein